MGFKLNRRARMMCALAVGSPLIARAANDTWTGSSGNWSTGDSWSLHHAPATTDNALVSNAGGAAVTLNLDTNAAVSQLSIDSQASGFISLNQSTNTFSTGTEFIGSNRAGLLSLNGGAHIVNNDLYLGYAASGSGVLSLNDGTFSLPNGTIHLGYQGTGTINQSGGLLLAVNTTILGDQIGSTGIFNQSGGTHTTGSLHVGENGVGEYSMSNGAVLNTIGSLIVGHIQSGSFTQTGGMTTVGQFLFVGNGGAGTLALSGGTLSATSTATYVGVNAPGAVNQTGGSLSTAALELGFASATGQYALNNGSLLVTGDTVVGDGASGSFTQSGGVASIGGSMTLGNASTGNGAGSVTGNGSLNISSALRVGGAGIGSFSQSGGVTTATALIAGVQAGSVGTLNVTGGSLAVAGTSSIGSAGSGVLNQTGGNASFSANLNVAAKTGSTGTISLTGGVLHAANLFLGGDSTSPGGAGILIASNGASLIVDSALTLYTNNANTVINLAGGTIATGSLNLAGNLSRLHWSSGSLNITGSNGLLIDALSSTGGSWPLTANQALSVTSTETIANGLFIQSGGVHTASVTVSPAGAYTFNNGVFNGAMSVAGTLTAAGGTFNGPLVVQSTGTAVVTGPLNATGGATVYGNVLVNQGGSLGGPTDIEGGIVTFTGGLLSGSMTNNGSITGYGTIAGAFTNNLVFTQSGGNITVDGSTAINAGSFSLASGRQLLLNSAFSNAGAMTLTGAIVGGSVTLLNSPFGTLTGPGTIASPFSNAGTLVVTGGTLNVNRVFTNTGVVQLTGIGSAINGGGIVNAATLQGSGSVGSPVNNTGTVEALNGTLVFFAPLTNAGVIRVATGNKLLLSSGVTTTNAGTLSLTGGTFDAGGAAFVNTGQITGYGTFASGGLTNSPGAAITLAGGTATINGPLTNSIGGTVRISLASAVFTEPVINNGTLIVSNASVTFASGFLNNGIYASDPSTTVANNFTIGHAGALVGGAGDRFLASGGFYSTSTQRALWDTRDAALTFAAGGSSTTHVMTITGTDIGPSLTGLDGNFAWGTLELAAGQSLSLDPESANDALYVTKLFLDGATADIQSFVATHLINTDAAHPANIYYDPTANAYLNDQTYPLGNGGLLAPIASTPEPVSLAFVSLCAAQFLRRRRFTRR